MKTVLSSFARDEAGATAIEYGLIITFVGLAIIVALTSLGSSLSTQFASIGGSFGSPKKLQRIEL